jgi:hypothetical protein
MKRAFLIIELLILAGCVAVVVWATHSDYPIFAASAAILFVALAATAWRLAKKWPLFVNIGLVFPLLLSCALLLFSPASKNDGGRRDSVEAK